MPTIKSDASSGGHAEPVIGRAFARPVGFTLHIPHAATTRGPGSTASDGSHGLLSIVTSEKPTALSCSHIKLRASDAIDGSGTTTARACEVSNSAGRSEADPASSNTWS
ncbi:hypothetical protein V1288_005260 [Bradyrhizobium sp. AZCC 2176]